MECCLGGLSSLNRRPTISSCPYSAPPTDPAVTNYGSSLGFIAHARTPTSPPFSPSPPLPLFPLPLPTPPLLLFPLPLPTPPALRHQDLLPAFTSLFCQQLHFFSHSPTLVTNARKVYAETDFCVNNLLPPVRNR